MLNTFLFTGHTCLHINKERIEMWGLDGGRTVKIHITDNEDMKINVTLQVFRLEEFKKTAFYMNTLEVDQEQFDNTWNTRISRDTIVKYSNEEQVAYTFTSDTDVEICFNKICALHLFNKGYFKEHAFHFFLEKQCRLSGFKELKRIEGMDANRIELLWEGKEMISDLMSKGITIQQIGSIKLARLATILNHPFEFENALKFIPVENILGLDNKQYLTKTFKTSNGRRRRRSFILKKRNEQFSVEYHRDGIKINFHDKNDNPINSCFIKEKKNEINFESEKLNSLKPCEKKEFIHDWYLLESPCKSSDAKKGLLIIPSEKSYFIEVLYDKQFPFELLKKKSEYLLFGRKETVYFSELNFVRYLEKQQINLHQYKNTYGMTVKKLELLCKNLSKVKILCSNGIDIKNFAKVDEHRLNYIFQHFEDAKVALKLITPENLLGLQKRLSFKSNLYPSPSRIELNIKPLANIPNCTIT